VTFELKKWFLKSISRQVSLLLVILLSTVLLLPAFYFYQSQKAAFETSTSQLATQLINSLRASTSKALLYNDHYVAWQLIKNQLKSNQQQIDSGGLFKISEIAILNKDNLVFAHSAPSTNPLQKQYIGFIPDEQTFPAQTSGIYISQDENSPQSNMRLYANAIYQGNRSGLIILQLDLSILDKLNQQTVIDFFLYYIFITIIIILTGIAFGKWISDPLKLIQASLTEMGSGKLKIQKLHQRHDEYHKLARALEIADIDLFDSHYQNDLLLDSTAEAIFGIDTNGTCTFVNKSCIELLKYNNKSELIGQNISKKLHLTAVDIQQVNHLENEIIWRKNNTHFTAEYWSHPIFKEDKCIGAVVTFLDITDRLEALKALKEREQYLSLMLHSIGDAVIATDAMGNITRMNPVAEKLTGWSFKEVRGEKVKNIFTIIDASSRTPIENPIDKVINSGEIVYLSNHTTLIAKNGQEYHIADSAAPIRDSKNNIQGMVLVFNDVTEQYQLRTQILEDKRRLQHIFDDMQNIVTILDIDGTLTFINNTPLKLVNLSSQDVLGKKLWDLCFFNYKPEVQRSVKNDCLKAASGIITFNDIALLTTDGLLWIEFSVHPVMNESGQVIQLVAEGRDINQRKEQEKALRRSQKMEAIGQLAGGIAHDFNNQLGVVIGYLDILKSTQTEDKQLQWIERSTQATLRCIDLTRQLLTFSRTKSTEKSIVNINETLQNLNTMIKRTVTPEVEVEYFPGNDLWLTEIDNGEFQDSILNLIINARDVMPNGGKLIIETLNKNLDKDYANNKLNIDAGEYVQIMISDTGCGMDKATLERIFEPFFTTKEEGKGTGLGLAMVYSFVNRFGGSIRFYSEIDIGTTIRMYLPRSVSAPAESKKITNNLNLPMGNETILIVDDEIDLLELAGKYLTDLGYIIKNAQNAQTALAILEQDSSIDLLFSDIVMPGGMNGYELAIICQKKWPAIKILLTSGFTSRVNAHNKPEKLEKKLLNKPYRKSELAKHIRQTLDGEK
jgi:PAS domain S-box-containing protein